MSQFQIGRMVSPDGVSALIQRVNRSKENFTKFLLVESQSEGSSHTPTQVIAEHLSTRLLILQCVLGWWGVALTSVILQECN